MDSQQRPATPAPNAPFAVMLRGAMVPTLVGGALTILVLGVLRGLDGALAALLGVVIAVIFFGVGLKIMIRVVDANPISVFAGAMAVYLGQLIFLAVIIIAMRDATWLDGLACGIAIFVSTMVWQVFQGRAYLRMRQTVYDEPPPPQEPSAGADGTQ
jgi:ATP synthase protein I